MKAIFLTVIFLGLANITLAQTNFHFASDFDNVKLDKNAKKFISLEDSLNIESNLAAHKEKSHGKFWIFYETVDLTKAKAEIVDAPLRNETKALHFHINEPNVIKNGNVEKARVQMQFLKEPGFKSFVNEVSVFLPKKMQVINDIPKPIKRFTLQEYWNDPVTLEGSVFTIKVGMEKKTNGKMYMRLSSRDYYDSKFHEVDYFKNEDWLVPFGVWFSLKTEIVEGDEYTGHVKLSVKKQSDDDYTVLIDTTARTMSRVYALKQKEPHGFTSLHALKLYTSKELVEWMRELNTPLDVYYSNWKFEGVTY